MKRENIEYSVVLPCLNEEATLETCIQKIHTYFLSTELSYEIIVADNGSTDNSVKIAETNQAIVVRALLRGYGSALRKGIEHSNGKYIIMGDADDSYNFLDISVFVDQLQAGYDMVMGNRFLGEIKKGAMPKLHRYIGNPVLSSLGRLLFQSKIGDFHCGLRAFTKDCYILLQPKCNGMEFASELVALASIHQMHICEVPVVLYPDGRDRKPHLRSWRDGFRHLVLLFTLFFRRN